MHGAVDQKTRTFEREPPTAPISPLHAEPDRKPMPRTSQEHAVPRDRSPTSRRPFLHRVNGDLTRPFLFLPIPLPVSGDNGDVNGFEDCRFSSRLSLFPRL